ncbi:MAG: hypothetical protein QME89_01250 [Actinomycetota bacterium]|nr:hypothetical protein [Actinomycetota bacterium]MDI7251166.1 hypothetical protein [Actinomycetota bacterium]
MRIRRYVGPDVPTVLRRIRRELGKDAVIVKTEEKVEGGLLGFFGTKVVEILAMAASDAPGGERRELDLTLPGELPPRDGRGGEGAGPSRTPAGGGKTGDSAALPGGGRVHGRGEIRDFLPLGIACEEGGMPRRALFFGPPGAGKTSALGRLAWFYSGRERVWVVSVEEEGRLSGATRWKAFWEVLGVDFVPVKGFEGLREVALEEGGVVFVDTPPLRGEELEEIKAACREFSLVPFLAVDACMDFEEFRGLWRQCQTMEDVRVVACKMDTVSLPSRRSRWSGELAGTRAYFTDHPSINVPLKPLASGSPSRRRETGRGENATAGSKGTASRNPGEKRVRRAR